MSRDATSPLSEKIPFIGRSHIVEKIIAAIKDSDRSRWLFYVTGAAGIGKTRLQEEVGRQVQALHDYDCRWSGIIDLFHTEFHSPGGVRQALIEALDPDNHHFQAYWKAREDYEKKRDRGVRGESIEASRLQLDEAFRRDYAALAEGNCRIVLSFDTVEFMQYESDAVQEICRVQEEGTIVKNWLLNQVSQLPNTVVVLAGRPRPKMEKQFVERYQDLSWQIEQPTLDEFTFEETQEYLAEIGRQAPELAEIIDDPDNQQQLFEISGGRPIYLAIILDLIRTDTGLTFGDIFETLTAEKVGMKLVDLYVHLDRPWYDIMYWLVRARKGLGLPLLQHLTNWDEAEARENMALAQGLAIVKHRAKTGQLFLHDEIYDRVDQYYRSDPTFVQSIEPVAAYYRQLGDPLELDSDALVARLYYEFRLDPERGYHLFYAHWDDQAIIQHNVGLDMRMRDEVLHFLNRYTEGELEDPTVTARIDRDKIDRDCAVRWLTRYFHRGQYKMADEVAHDLRHSANPLFQWDAINDPMYKASHSEIWGIAKIYRGKPEPEIRSVLNEAIKILSNQDVSWTKHDSLWIPRILGRAYVNAGYWHRQNRRYKEALKFYDRAINHLSQTDATLDRAMALTNRAYVQAILGYHSAAKNQIAEAIDLHKIRFRKKDGPSYDYWSTLTLNVRGAVHRLSTEPQMAIGYHEQAKVQFETLDEKRGMAISNLSLGMAYRLIANVWEDDQTKIEESLDHYRKGLGFLDQALKFFEKNPSGDLINTHLEKARIIRSQGQVSLFQGQYERAQELLTEAWKIFELVVQQTGDAWPIQKMDAIEDQVDILVLQRKFNEASQAILKAEAIAHEKDPRYLLGEQSRFEEIEQPTEDYWNVLARLELHRAHIIILKALNILPSLPVGVLPKTDQAQLVSKEERTEALQKAMTHYARSFTYFFAFSPDLETHDKTLAEIFRLLKDQDSTTQQKVRQQVVDIDNQYPNIRLDPLLRHIDQALAVPTADDETLLL